MYGKGVDGSSSHAVHARAHCARSEYVRTYVTCLFLDLVYDSSNFGASFSGGGSYTCIGLKHMHVLRGGFLFPWNVYSVSSNYD